MRSRIITLATTLLLGFTGSSQATVTVTNKVGSGSQPAPVVSFNGSTWSINFSSGPGTGVQYDYEIKGDANDIISSISVNTGTGTIGLACFPLAGTETIGNGILQINAITKSGSGSLVWEWFEVEGAIPSGGPVIGDAIGRVMVASDVSASITSSGAITGRIDVGGNLTASILANGGNITGPIVVGGLIGTSPTQRVNIRAKGTLGSISADEIYADINPNFVDANTDGQDDALDGSVGNVTASSGDFAGSLYAGQFAGTLIDIYNDLKAAVTFGQALGTSGATQVRVGHSLLGEIQLPSQGIGGAQIVINRRNLASPSNGVWGEDVKLGTGMGQVVLSGDEYANLPSEVGGSNEGAVGLVPYRIHGEACDPIEGDTITVRPTTIKVRYYGSVEWTGSDPFVLERRSIGTTTWYASGDGCFSTYTGSGGRNVQIVIPSSFIWQTDHEYRVRAKLSGDEVRCDVGLTPEPLVADDLDYIFTTDFDCTWDLNGDGCTNGADLSVLLANFGTSHANCGQPGDINGDDFTNGADLSVLLANFEKDCNGETCEGARFAGGSGSIIGHFGFETNEAYTEWVSGLNSQELEAHLQDLLELLAE